MIRLLRRLFQGRDGGRGAGRGAARVARRARRVGGAGRARPRRARHARRARALALGARAAARGRAPAGAGPRRRTRRSSPPSSARTTSPPRAWPRRATRSARCAATSCPGPSACSTWPTRYAGDCRVTVNGTPRELRVRGAPGRVPHRPGGAHERAPPQRRGPRRDRARLRGRRHAARSSRTTDRGRRSPSDRAATGGGYGLTGMRERAELLGGRLSAQPTADGFRVELWLPR